MSYHSLPVRAVPVVLVGLTGLFLALAGCSEEVEPPTPPPQEDALSFSVIGRGQQATLHDTTEVVIRDLSSWTALQDSLRPLQPFEAVDFDREMVLVTAVPVPTGGYSVDFEAVGRIDGTLRARYVLITPGDDCMATMGMSVAFQAVRVGRIDGPVRFEHREEPYRCTLR